ncbi:hypothetical protein ACJX0J_020750, partial [Zea mays]
TSFTEEASRTCTFESNFCKNSVPSSARTYLSILEGFSEERRLDENLPLNEDIYNALYLLSGLTAEGQADRAKEIFRSSRWKDLHNNTKVKAQHYGEIVQFLKKRLSKRIVDGHFVVVLKKNNKRANKPSSAFTILWGNILKIFFLFNSKINIG